jgi:hypothetical protein
MEFANTAMLPPYLKPLIIRSTAQMFVQLANTLPKE